MRLGGRTPMNAIDNRREGSSSMFRSPFMHRLVVTAALLVGAAICAGWKWAGH
jgi:hypothetical protein